MFQRLEELGINDITDLRFSYNKLETDTGETIADKEKIVLTFEPEPEVEKVYTKNESFCKIAEGLWSKGSF